MASDPSPDLPAVAVPSGAPEPAAEVARELRIAVGRLHRRLRAVANEGALSASQSSALARIAKGEAASAAELAALDGVRPQSMAATVGVLEQDGLIARSPDPTDGRRSILSLTVAGEQRWRGDRAARQEWLTRTLRERLAPEELESLRAAAALLQRLTDR